MKPRLRRVWGEPPQREAAQYRPQVGEVRATRLSSSATARQGPLPIRRPALHCVRSLAQVWALPPVGRDKRRAAETHKQRKHASSRSAPPPPFSLSASLPSSSPPPMHGPKLRRRPAGGPQ